MDNQRAMILARIAFFFILSAPVWAADGPDYAKDPAIGVKRVVTKATKTTDSKCVGDPKTPVCAMETVVACLVRQSYWLCHLVGIKKDRFQFNTDKSEYIIEAIRIPSNEEIEGGPKPGKSYAKITFQLDPCNDEKNISCAYAWFGDVLLSTEQKSGQHWRFEEVPDGVEYADMIADKTTMPE
jgi:hypothetical protein